MQQDTWEKLAKYVTNELNSEEAKVFEKWIEQDKENIALVRKAKKLWEANEEYRELSNVDFLNIIGSQSNKVWQEVEKGIKEESPLKWIYRVAALVIIMIGLGWGYFQLENTIDRPLMVMELVESKDTKKTIVLADGTSVWLNKNSSLSYPEEFEGPNRVVELKGEAFFSVSKDESHPFIVKTSKSQVEVIGTSFNVRAKVKEKRMEVTVSEGKVSLNVTSNLDNKIYLKKGERGVHDISTGQVSKHSNSDANFLSWKTGVLKFENQSLGEVLKAISEHYGISAKSQDQTILGRNLTITFDNQNYVDVLGIICNKHGLDMNVQGNEILISKN